MNSEYERLQQMYRELGDEHLQDLADEPDDLTEEARMALAAEQRRRGWTPTAEPYEAPVVIAEPELQSGFGPAIPGIIPAGASAVEQALEPGGELRQGMLRLISFFDGHELSRACESLEDEDLDFAIEEVAGDAMSGLAPHFELWVEPATQELAQRVLREKMGLFPPPEVHNDASGSDGVIGIFDSRAEAEEVSAALLAEGFTARIEAQQQAQQQDQQQNDPGFAVTVAPQDQERALQAAAARMGLQ